MALMDIFGLCHNITDRFAKFRQSRSLILFIVFVAIFLDNMLLTTVVPVVPNFLRKQESPYIHVNRTVVVSVTEATPMTPTPTIMCVPRKDKPDGDREGYMWIRTVTEYYVPSTVPPVLCYNESSDDFDRNASHTSYVLVTEEIPRSAELGNENVRVGVLFASKAIVQLLANPFMGPLTNRIGYTIPMFTGFVVMMVSTIIFAFGESYLVLFIARSVQGIGSSCSSVAGMGMLACYYPDDKERGNAMGIALGGLALGVLLGPHSEA